MPLRRKNGRPDDGALDGPEGAIVAFVSGRASYDALVERLKTIDADGTAGPQAIRHAIETATGEGQLPIDLGQILMTLFPGGGASGETLPDDAPVAPEDDLFDEDTLPYAVGTPSSAGAAAPAEAPEPAPIRQSGLPPVPPAHAPVPDPLAPPPQHDEVRNRVDDVVLSALISDFRNMRHGRTADDEPSESRRDELSGFLSDYKSARYRADARRAARNGVTQGMNLSDLDDYARRRAGLGSILRDRFILDAEIGRGGMGVVYAAVDRRRLEAGTAQPYVALKLLNDEFRGNADALRVLEAEARKAQSLAHPNIATVYDFDRDRAEVFIVMELLTGQPLTRHIAASLGTGMPGGRIAAILKGICSALSYAHQHGVVHSDLKPGNVFITEDNVVKLLDFGLSTAGTLGGFDASTLDGLTEPYASPEMFDGAPRDPRDDIFALGCIAYQLLTGTHPFAMRGTDEAVRLGMEPEPITDLDPAAWEVIRSALSFDREARIATVDEFFNGIFES